MRKGYVEMRETHLEALGPPPEAVLMRMSASVSSTDFQNVFDESF